MTEERQFRTTIVDARKISDTTVMVTEHVEEVREPYANLAHAKHLKGLALTRIRTFFPFKPEEKPK